MLLNITSPVDSVWQTAEFPREAIPQAQMRQGDHSREAIGGFSIALSPDQLENPKWEPYTPKIVKLTGQSLCCSVRVAHPPSHTEEAEV